MTISTSSSSITIGGSGANTTFAFSFIADSASDISVYYTNASGVITELTPSQYTLTINAPAVNQLWGIGGTVIYPLTGSPIAVGTSITIARLLPYTQEVSIQNQGNYYAQVTEQALDTLEMQIQQLAAVLGRTIQFPVVDNPLLISTLPAAAQRANQFVSFDSNGNVIAATPAGAGVPISSAMQPVVEAVTLAAARALLGVQPVTGRIIKAGTSDTMTSGDGIVEIALPSAVAFTENLPTSPVEWQIYTVKDGNGTASSSTPITVVPPTGNLDGAANFEFVTPWQAQGFYWNGTNWRIVN